MVPFLLPFVLHPAAVVAVAPWSWPTAPAVVLADFDPPSQRWLAGHRGIDLATQPGQPVTAVASGIVRFSGQVAGAWTVSIDHGGVRSTYQPVLPLVAEGEPVAAGEVIGRVADVPWHCPQSCLHLGARVGASYADPRRLLGEHRIVLKPLRPGATRPADAPATPLP